MPYQIPDHPIRVRSGTGEEHLRRLFPRQLRLKEIAKSVTKLVDQERLELPYFRAYETRNYTERVRGQCFVYSTSFPSFDYHLTVTFFPANRRGDALRRLPQTDDGGGQLLPECKQSCYFRKVFY